MKVTNIATVRRQAAEVARVTKRGRCVRDNAEIAGYRRQIRGWVKATERRALTGDKDDPARLAAVKSLAAMVLGMYVAEHNLREEIQRAVAATAVA